MHVEKEHVEKEHAEKGDGKAMDALTVEKLCLRRGNFMVYDTNFNLPEGQMLAIGGKSGAGKTTLVYGIGGALQPEAGSICYWGQSMYENEISIRSRMSVVYDVPNFNVELKPERLVKEIMKFEPDFDREAFGIYMEQLELNPRMRVKLYSIGMQKKLMLVLALCRNPHLLVMDEPTSGVEDSSKALMWSMIENYRKEHEVSVVFTTHHESEMQRAQKMIRIDKGSCQYAPVVQKEQGA